jgi:tRNA (guanosine-2'-O-)-methyltransferase
MIDLDYLTFLEYFNRQPKEKFLKVLKIERTTIVVEDIFQMHNTSAVMRSCEIFGIQELNVIEQRYGKVLIKPWAPKMG